MNDDDLTNCDDDMCSLNSMSDDWNFEITKNEKLKYLYASKYVLCMDTVRCSKSYIHNVLMDSVNRNLCLQNMYRRQKISF